VHTGYVVRARLLPLQEFAVEVAEFDFEFLACGVGEFGEGCTIEPVRLPAPLRTFSKRWKRLPSVSWISDQFWNSVFLLISLSPTSN
jgi:hypothetical protein